METPSRQDPAGRQRPIYGLLKAGSSQELKRRIEHLNANSRDADTQVDRASGATGKAVPYLPYPNASAVPPCSSRKDPGPWLRFFFPKTLSGDERRVHEGRTQPYFQHFDVRLKQPYDSATAPLMYPPPAWVAPEYCKLSFVQFEEPIPHGPASCMESLDLRSGLSGAYQRVPSERIGRDDMSSILQIVAFYQKLADCRPRERSDAPPLVEVFAAIIKELSGLISLSARTVNELVGIRESLRESEQREEALRQENERLSEELQRLRQRQL